MHGFSSSFPHGGPGLGLLLLRLTVAMQLLTGACAAAPLPWWQLALFILLVLLLTLGMLTPVAAAVSVLYQLICLSQAALHEAPALATAILTAIALVLLGPGAYAADARLFGRRRVLLPPDPANHKDYSIHLGEKK